LCLMAFSDSGSGVMLGNGLLYWIAGWFVAHVALFLWLAQ
jgi:hypothetical protein